MTNQTLSHIDPLTRKSQRQTGSFPEDESVSWFERTEWIAAHAQIVGQMQANTCERRATHPPQILETFWAEPRLCDDQPEKHHSEGRISRMEERQCR